MNNTYSSLMFAVTVSISSVACGGSNPPPTDQNGAAHSGSTTPESGNSDSNSGSSTAPEAAPESPPGADTAAANTK